MALARALFMQSDPVPPQTAALASIWWPIILTTNYDNFYVRAFAEAFDAGGLAVVGRGSEDCQRVLTSLSTAGRALLWALQGHIAAPAGVDGHEKDRRLANELVIDHAEYRRVTHREPDFRRAFAEVFRHRSLLFLGSGLRETYLQDLFGEVLELYGPSTRTHYAIMPRGDVDPPFMFARFQIVVVEYPPLEHGFVPQCLAELRAASELSPAVPVIWRWGRAQGPDLVATGAGVDLEIVRGPLPREPCAGECLVVSAGGSLDQDLFYVSKEMQPTVEAWCRNKNPSLATSPWLKKLSPTVGEYLGYDAFAVRARREHDDTKDLLRLPPRLAGAVRHGVRSLPLYSDAALG